MAAAQHIPLEAITSSNLAAIGYDDHKQILAIQFKSGDVFHYAGVPSHVVDQFYLSESRGKFYAQSIRGKFTGQKMTGHCPDCGAKGWVGERCPDCGCKDVVDDQPKARAAK